MKNCLMWTSIFVSSPRGCCHLPPQNRPRQPPCRRFSPRQRRCWIHWFRSRPPAARSPTDSHLDSVDLAPNRIQVHQFIYMKNRKQMKTVTHQPVPTSIIFISPGDHFAIRQQRGKGPIRARQALHVHQLLLHLLRVPPAAKAVAPAPGHHRAVRPQRREGAVRGVQLQHPAAQPPSDRGTVAPAVGRAPGHHL